MPPNTNVADDVADLLAAQAWPGWTVHVNEMPAAPDTVIGIFEAGGDPPGTRLEIDRPAVQIRVRAGKHDWPAARAKIKEVFDLLHKRTGTLTDTYYVAIMAAGGVLPLGLDANERPHLAQTFSTMRSR